MALADITRDAVLKKTGHRNALIEAIGGTRSPGSVERKHQNISAVML